jgi:RimJ/RimL family protein N-acetyltransferase
MTEATMKHNLRLREMIADDLLIFFEQQLDPDANWMAAFTAKDPTDRGAFDEHWEKVLADRGLTIRTILLDGQVAGSVLCHAWGCQPEISYWLGREFWGKNIASEAGRLNSIKEAIIKILQPFKPSDGIHFTKLVFFVCGI